MGVGRGLLIKASVSPAGHRCTRAPLKLYNAVCVIFVDVLKTLAAWIYQRTGVDQRTKLAKIQEAKYTTIIICTQHYLL